MVYGLQKGAGSTDQAGNRMSEQQMIENIKQSVQQCQQKAEMMLNKYEDVVVEAEKILQEQAGPETPMEQSEAGEKPEMDFWQILPTSFIKTTKARERRLC